jgi:hypothetical protein
MTHKKLAWASAVKIWNQQNAWADDMYALPKKAGQYYQDIVDIIAEYGGPKPVVPEPVALPPPAPVVAPSIEPVISMAELRKQDKEKALRDAEEIERKREQLKKANLPYKDKIYEFWQGKMDNIKRQTDFYKEIKEWRQFNVNRTLAGLAGDTNKKEFVEKASRFFASAEDAGNFWDAFDLEYAPQYPSVDIVDSKPKGDIKPKEADPNELTADEQRQINTSIFNSRMAKEERKKNSETYVKSVFDDLRENMKAKPKTPEPPAKESEEVYGLTADELKLRKLNLDETKKMLEKPQYEWHRRLSNLPKNDIKAGFRWLKSKWGGLYAETLTKVKKLQDSGDFSKANRKKTMRIDFDSSEQQKEYFMDLYFADPYVWEQLNFNIAKAPAMRRPEGEFKKWNK